MPDLHKRSLRRLWISVSVYINRHVNSSELLPLFNSASSEKPNMVKPQHTFLLCKAGVEENLHCLCNWRFWNLNNYSCLCLAFWISFDATKDPTAHLPPLPRLRVKEIFCIYIFFLQNKRHAVYVDSGWLNANFEPRFSLFFSLNTRSLGSRLA